MDTTEKKLEVIVREAINAEPEGIKQQIDNLKAVRNDIIQHYSDVEKVRDTGDDLGSAHTAVKRDVDYKVDEIVKRYQALQATLEDRLEVLRDAMTAALDLQDQLDMLLKWLDQAENDVHKMEKGTLLVVQKEPLIENSEAQQVVFKDIEDHKPTVDTVNRVATTHMQTKGAQEAKEIKTELDNINKRYGKVREGTVNHGDTLRSLTDRLNDFERQVDEMEENVLPSLKTLGSKEFMRKDIPQITSNLKNLRQQVDNQRPVNKRVHQLGEQLISEPKANDTSHVKAILANVDVNWAGLDDILAKRAKQLDDLNASTKKYNGIHKDTNFWLEGMERRLQQAQTTARDSGAIKAKIKELKSGSPEEPRKVDNEDEEQRLPESITKVVL